MSNGSGTWTDPKGHTWDVNTDAQSWTRKTAKRVAAIYHVPAAPFPYQLGIETHSGVTLDGMGFETLDAAAIMAHHQIH